MNRNKRKEEEDKHLERLGAGLVVIACTFIAWIMVHIALDVFFEIGKHNYQTSATVLIGLVVGAYLIGYLSLDFSDDLRKWRASE